MKQTILILMLLASNYCNAQNCCATFADLGRDSAFRHAHEMPSADTNFVAVGEMISYPTALGGNANAYFIKAAVPSSLYLVIIHEWWGLNDHIKREADRYAQQLPHVNILAVDLYDGKVATTREDAAKFMQAAKEERINAILEGARVLAGDQAKLATIGWCFGGGWSLKASLLFGKQAAGCVMYYGMPVFDKNELAKLQADVLAIFATQDAWITPEIAADFEKLMNELGKNLTVLHFDADHAFANPSSPRYKEEAAQKANRHALEFLKSHLK